MDCRRAVAALLLIGSLVLFLSPTRASEASLQGIPDSGISVQGADSMLQRAFLGEGRIGCALTLQSTTIMPGRGQVPDLPPCGDTRTRMDFTPTPEQAITAGFFELTWGATTQGSERLSLLVPAHNLDARLKAVCTNGDFNPNAHKVVGTSPLRLALVTDPDAEVVHLWAFRPGGKMTFIVDPEAADVIHELPPIRNVVLFQPFELSARLFYAGDAGANPSSTCDLAKTSPDGRQPLANPLGAGWVPEGPLSASRTTYAWGLGLVAAAAALFAASLNRIPRLPRLVAGWPFFSRLQESRLLDHPTRRALAAYVRAQPGVGYEEARLRLGLAAGTFDHHLHVLVRHGLARVEMAFGRARIFAAPEAAVSVELSGDLVPERVLRLVAAEPGLRQVDVARRLDLPPTTVAHHATWLARGGRLERRPDGRAVRYYPIADASPTDGADST